MAIYFCEIPTRDVDAETTKEARSSSGVIGRMEPRKSLDGLTCLVRHGDRKPSQLVSKSSLSLEQARVLVASSAYSASEKEEE